MAYDANTDYTAIKNTLKKQIDATTDSATKAALQSQYDAAEQSRTEKLASNLTKYGKYASDSELDSAAGIAAQNQIGTGYETQKANLNKSYDIANQNANNDALSRGMGRDTYVSDRLATLGSERANALSDVDAARATALQNAKSTILNNYQTTAKNDLATEKSDYTNTIGAYSNDYQAEVNKVTNNNDPSDDWKIPILQAARQQKIASQQNAQATADQQAIDNQINYLKATKTSSKSGGGSGGDTGSGTDMTYSQVKSALDTMRGEGSRATPEDMYNFVVSNGGKYTDQLLSIYGLANSAPKAVTKLSDDAASYQVGMNRTAKGQKATLQNLTTSGQITEAQAQSLISKFGLG